MHCWKCTPFQKKNETVKNSNRHSNTLSTSPSGALVASALDHTPSPPGPTRSARGPRVAAHWLGPARLRCGPVTGLELHASMQKWALFQDPHRPHSARDGEKRRGAAGPPSAFLASPKQWPCSKCHLGACHQPVKSHMRPKTGTSRTSRVRVATYMGMPRATNGHMMAKCAAASMLDDMCTCHYHRGSPSDRHHLSFSSYLAGQGVATGREEESAEARHLMCVDVCFFALINA